MAEANLGTARGRIEIDADGAVRAFSDTESAAAGFMGGLEAHSRTLDRTGKALVGIGVAALGGLGVAVKTSAGFEQAMNRVGAVSGATGKEFDRLKDTAKELGRTTMFSASQAADAMYYLSSAGFNTNEIISAMPGILDLAAAGNMDLARASDIASNILSGYGFEAADVGRVNDVLASTFSNANTNIEQLGDAMKFVAPVASASGVSFEEAAAAIGKLSDAGIQGGMAGTTLRGIIAALENPTAAASKALERLGVETHDASGKMLPLADIVENLETAGLSTADAMQIFGARAGPGMMALVSQGSDALRELTGQLENSGGAAEEMALRQMEGLNGSLTELRSAIEGALIGIGDQLLPMITGWAQGLTKLVQGFANLSPRMQAFIAFGTAIGGVLAIVSGAMLMILARIPMMVQGIRAVSQAFMFLAANPVFMTIAALAAIAAALIYLWNTNEQFRESIQRVIGWIQSNVIPVFQRIADIVRGALASALDWLRGAWESLQPTIERTSGVLQNIAAIIHGALGSALEWLRETWEKLQPRIESIREGLQGMTSRFAELAGIIMPIAQAIGSFLVGALEKLWSVAGPVLSFMVQAIGALLVGAFQKLWAIAGPILGFLVNLIGNVLRTAIDGVVQVFQGAVQIINGILDVFIGLFTGNWSQMWEGVKGIAVGIFNAIVGLVKVWLSVGILGAVRSIFVSILAFFRGALTSLRGIFTGALNSIRNNVQGSFNAVRSLVQNVMNAIRSFLQGVWNSIRGNVSSSMNSIRSLIQTVWNSIRTIITTVLNGIRATITAVMNAIRSVITSVWNAIRSTITTVVNAIRSVVTSVFNAIRTLMTTAANGARTAVVNAFNLMRSGVSNAINGLLTFVRSIPSRIVSALGNIGRLLIGAGKALISGFLDGIKSMISKPIDAVKGMASKIRGFLPGSPAEEGPFSGKGWTLYSGRSLIDDLADGMRDQERQAVKVTEGLANALAGTLKGAMADPAIGALRTQLIAPVGPTRGASGQTRQAEAQPARQDYNFYGDIVLPNVTDPDDFFSELESAARARSR